MAHSNVRFVIGQRTDLVSYSVKGAAVNKLSSGWQRKRDTRRGGRRKYLWMKNVPQVR